MLFANAHGTLLGMILIGGVLLVISSFLIVRFESGAPAQKLIRLLRVLLGLDHDYDSRIW